LRLLYDLARFLDQRVLFDVATFSNHSINDEFCVLPRDIQLFIGHLWTHFWQQM